MKNLTQIGEFPLIDQLTKDISVSSSVIKGIGDDTAVFVWDKSKYGLLTTDMLVENVHFNKSMMPRSVGYKSLACSISDIAAMGGIPKHTVVSMGLPARTPLRYVKGLYAGIMSLAKKFNVNIVGGDTVKSEKIIINVAMMGTVKKSQLVLRSKAKKGDYIFVTGKLGRSFETNHHFKFVPRINESQYLVKKYLPSSMIDLSDGLVGDINHILAKSNKSATLYEEQIPLRKKASIKDALNQGEDFELLFTLAPERAKSLMRAHKNRFRFWHIGHIGNGNKRLTLISKEGKPQVVKLSGYRHF